MVEFVTEIYNAYWHGSREPVITIAEKSVKCVLGHALFKVSQLPITSGGARRRRRRRPPTASRLKGPRKQKSFAYKLLKRGLANLMSPTSTSGVAPPLPITICELREKR
ncbi:hypothetical protein EVAR_70604_1 [Eumeta japonica]|uniref:Uncharacterized protein n=1 Tax=Eumeta variegata TaxID=151549 RepID=A0A4C1STY7_EUMVA|nr:hypothetical protein EVAR_70604_1 [Eumeta japonica]